MASIKKYMEGLAIVVANLPQTVIIVDPRYSIQYVNGSAPEFLGYVEYELLNSSLSKLFDAKCWRYIRHNIDCLLDDKTEGYGRSNTLAATVIKSNGKKVPQHITIAKIHSQEGGYDTLLHFDYLPPALSPSSPTEKQLGAASAGAELVSALDMLEDSVIILDDKWRYQFVNKAGWEVLNLSPEEVLGHNVWKLRPDLKGSQWQKTALKAMKYQKSYKIEGYYPRSQQWYITSFYPSPHSLMCHMENVTALKETQQMNSQLLGTLEEAMEVYWTKENRAKREGSHPAQGGS